MRCWDLHLSKWKRPNRASATGNTGILEAYLISLSGFALNTAGRNSLSTAVCLEKKRVMRMFDLIRNTKQKYTNDQCVWADRGHVVSRSNLLCLDPFSVIWDLYHPQQQCFPTLVLDICLEMRWLSFWKRCGGWGWGKKSLMNSRGCD